jgi:heterodisulfide reductase subunit C
MTSAKSELEFIMSQIHARGRYPNFMHEVANTPRGEGVLSCIQCGRCAGSCPVGRLTPNYNPRRLIEMVNLGFKWEALFELSWLCLSCFTCIDRCPQGADVGEVVFALRSIAARDGNIPKGALTMAKNLVETGHIVNPTASVNKQRASLGLPPREPVPEVAKIAKKTDLSKMLVSK